MAARGDSDRLVSLLRLNRPLQVDAQRDLLLSHGIPAMSRPTAMLPGIQEFYAPDQTRAEVCVYARDLERAQRLLAELAGEVEMIDELALPEASVATFRFKGLDRRLGQGIVWSGLGLIALAIFPFMLVVTFAKWVASLPLLPAPPSEHK